MIYFGFYHSVKDEIPAFEVRMGDECDLEDRIVFSFICKQLRVRKTKQNQKNDMPPVSIRFATQTAEKPTKPIQWDVYL